MSNFRSSRIVLAIGILCLWLTATFVSAYAQRGGRGGGEDQEQKTKIKPYEEVITEKAITDDGVFKTHRVDEKLYFEIPQNEIGQLFLWVTQVKENTTGSGYGGQSIGNKVVRWDRRGDKILLRLIRFSITADESKAVYNAVKAASFPAIIKVFDIEAYGENESMVIDATSLYTSDVSEFSARQRLSAGSLDRNRSFIERVASYPENIETESILTFSPGSSGGAAAGRGGGRGGGGGQSGSISVVMHYSMIHLPEEPMMPRLLDSRVGFFSHNQLDYGIDSHQTETRRYIARWRLEKKDPNAALSEPVKPIVYWIDRGVPEKWKPYLKQGIEDWQAAFEAAGFKNAILGKYAPTIEEDPEWSIEDARYASISWKATTTQNASGPHVSDPRTGEILDSDINFHHNVMRLTWNWYFAQVGPLDKRAQKLPIPDDLIGELLRYVASHEVGHTLGLQHNMKASSAYTVEQLRDAGFTRKFGNEASIMDYGRFNYVAQPGDNARLIPMIGPYDKFAIEWGYKPIAGANTPDDEKAALDKWASRQSDNPMLRWSSSYSHDPSASTEDLGSDPVAATRYGLMNIKRVIPMVLPAVANKGDDYTELESLYNTVIGQMNREFGHVVGVIGGVVTTEYHFGQKGEGSNYVPIDRKKQKEALQFLNENVFTTPDFILDDEILSKIEPSGQSDRILQSQRSVLNSVLSDSRAKRMIDIEAKAKGEPVYTLEEMLGDLREGIWTELIKGDNEIDVYRRNLQRTYVRIMANKIKPPEPSASPQTPGGRGGRGGGGGSNSVSDMRPLARGELQEISELIDNRMRNVTDRMTRLHLEDIKASIQAALKID